MRKIVLIVTLLISVSLYSQREKDTVSVILLFSDTTYWRVSRENNNGEWRTIGQTNWMKAYSVREKHNTSEGVMDAGFNMCTDQMGNRVPCYNDYWEHLLYLDEKKRPLSKKLIVWQSLDAK